MARLAPSDPFGLVGQVLDGQFRVDSVVGEGGFSVVFRGLHVGLNEPIAIKCLKLPAALGSALVESFVRRFRDESRLHYKLSQGNLHIVRAIASGTMIAPATSALVPYTVLEWLEGRSLADEFVARRTRGMRGRPLAEAVKMLDSAVDAVAYAHAQGVVHRDLNPGNLFLAETPAGVKLKVLDFGVAKIMADAAIAMGPQARTVGNVRMFAPAYGAPEQFDESVGAVGPWSDAYAIALVTLEAMGDRTVMGGEHLGEFALKALDRSLRPTPRALGLAVGDEVEGVFARALSVSPGERPQDAGELWGMLKHAMTVDAASGRAPHAVATPSDPPPPNTLRLDTPVPEGTSPVVEVVRPPSHAPPGMPGSAPPPARSLTGTVRMASSPFSAHVPGSASEALAATPAPMPTSTVRMLTPLPPPPMDSGHAGPSPYSLEPPEARIVSPMAGTGPGAPVRPPPVDLPLRAPPSPTRTPPPIHYPRSLSLPPEDARGGSRTWLVLLAVLLLIGLAGGGFWISRHRAAPPEPAAETPRGG